MRRPETPDRRRACVDRRCSKPAPGHSSSRTVRPRRFEKLRDLAADDKGRLASALVTPRSDFLPSPSLPSAPRPCRLPRPARPRGPRHRLRRPRPCPDVLPRVASLVLRFAPLLLDLSLVSLALPSMRSLSTASSFRLDIVRAECPIRSSANARARRALSPRRVRRSTLRAARRAALSAEHSLLRARRKPDLHEPVARDPAQPRVARAVRLHEELHVEAVARLRELPFGTSVMSPSRPPA